MGENPPRSGNDDEQAAFARGVLEAEAAAIQCISIDTAFHEAVDRIMVTKGSVVVTGLGKSYLIGQKISATFASTGTPSHVIHPTEAMHGDLGRIRRQDLVLALSYSGTTDEVVALTTILRQDEVPVIAIVGVPNGHLDRLATITLCVGDVKEACPLNLAPTASATAMLALGDALALAVSRRRHFGVADFQRVHPGGSLGRQLMLVTEAMRFRVDHNLPLVGVEMSVAEAFRQTDQPAPGLRRSGAVLIVDSEGHLAGIFTDADFRRAVLKFGSGMLAEPIGSFMTEDPRYLDATCRVRDAVQMVRQWRIDEIPVVDAEGQPLGMIDVQDLISLRVIDP